MTTSEIDKEHIERRIEDWKERISNLYKTIESWLDGSDFKIRRGPDSVMFEELMATFEVPATKIPTIDILKGKKFKMSVKPKGLWIIGANGRIDLTTLLNTVILVDTAEQFQEPHWKLYNNSKTNGVDFNKEVFLQLL